MRGHSWTNVEGSTSFEIKWNDLEDKDAKNPHELQLLIIDALVQKGNVNINPREEFEYICLNVEFLSSGYYDPGQRYGPPEDCEPPDGDDERTLVSVSITTTNHEEVELDEDLAEKLFNKYSDKIYEEEIEE